MKKILSLALAGVMMFSALPVAYAADYTAGTQVEYIADADANREYTITVPALLNPGQSGAVTLKGKWASNETVKVTADASVELTNSINAADKHTLDITFPGIEKAGDNTVEKTYTENVAVAEMPAAALFGTWSGKFNYNVEFDDGAEPVAPTVMFKDVKYMRTDDPEYAENWILFKSDGTIYQGGPAMPDGLNTGSYTTNGQNVTNGLTSGTFSDDGYTFTTDGATSGGVPYVYTYTP